MNYDKIYQLIGFSVHIHSQWNFYAVFFSGLISLFSPTKLLWTTACGSHFYHWYMNKSTKILHTRDILAHSPVEYSVNPIRELWWCALPLKCAITFQSSQFICDWHLGNDDGWRRKKEQQQQIICDLLNPIETGNESTTSFSKYPYGFEAESSNSYRSFADILISDTYQHNE